METGVGDVLEAGAGGGGVAGFGFGEIGEVVGFDVGGGGVAGLEGGKEGAVRRGGEGHRAQTMDKDRRETEMEKQFGPSREKVDF